MKILEMVNVWRNGCSCSMRYTKLGKPVRNDPWICQSCTEGLIDAIAVRMRNSEHLRNADDATEFLNKPVTK